MTKTKLTQKVLGNAYAQRNLTKQQYVIICKGIKNMTEAEATSELNELNKLLNLPGLPDPSYITSRFEKLIKNLIDCGQS